MLTVTQSRLEVSYCDCTRWQLEMPVAAILYQTTVFMLEGKNLGSYVAVTGNKWGHFRKTRGQNFLQYTKGEMLVSYIMFIFFLC